MDRFFPEKILGEIFWDEPLLTTDQSDDPPPPPPPATIQSAFVQYRDLLPRRINSLNGPSFQSMSKRMLSFMRKRWPAMERNNNVQENERDRSFRHMINERMRRQRQRECCLALHSMLPHGTKTDNNSVIQMAAKEIVRLQGCREELQRKNVELEVGGNQVQYLRIPHPESAIDSMVENLKCLKYQGVDTTSVKSTFSPQELFAVLEIQNHDEVAYADVESATWRTHDRKLHSHGREGSNKKQKTIHEALDQI